jgi:hypothetical protein
MQILASFEPPQFRSEGCSPLWSRSRFCPCSLLTFAQSNEALGARQVEKTASDAMPLPIRPRSCLLILRGHVGA